MMVLINDIIVGWSICGVNIINLMLTSLYEFTKGNITKIDVIRRLRKFTPNELSKLTHK